MLKLFIRISIVALLLAVALPLFAEDAKKQTPTQIESDNMKYFGEKQMSTFTGHVVVIQEGMKMTSDSMDVFFTETREVKEIFSKGNVRIEKEDMLALAEEARMSQSDQKVVLTGNARVWQGENYLEGEKVTMYLDTNKLFVDKGADDKRVRIIITPQKESN